MTIQYVNTGFILSLISDDSKGTTIFLLVLPRNCLKVNKRDAPVQKCKIRPFGCLVYRLYSFLSNLLSRSKSCLEQLQIICLCETCPFPWSSLPGDLRNSGRFEFIGSSQACFKLKYIYIYTYICRRICKRDVHRGYFSWPALDWGAATSILH